MPYTKEIDRIYNTYEELKPFKGGDKMSKPLMIYNTYEELKLVQGAAQRI